MSDSKNIKARRLLKAVLWISAVWFALLIILQIALSPAVLTTLVNNIAARYVDGNLDFGRASVSVFRHFPNVSVSLDTVSLTYPTERYAGYDSTSTARILRMGKGAEADTLASFGNLKVTLDAFSLLGGRIHISDIELNRARIHARQYTDSIANWNIFRLQNDSPAEDTTDEEGGMPDIVLERISLKDKPFISYCSLSDTLYAIVVFKDMDFNGRLTTAHLNRSRIDFNVDSLAIAGRLASDSLGFRLQNFSIRQRRDIMDVSLTSSLGVATRSYGRMQLPLDLRAEFTLPDQRADIQDSKDKEFEIRKFEADIAGIPLRAHADIIYTPDSIYVKGTAGIERCNFADLIDQYASHILPALKGLNTDATLSATAAIDGWYCAGSGQFPSFDATVTIPNASFAHKDIHLNTVLDLDATATGGGDSPIGINIRTLTLDGSAVKANIKAGVSDLLGEDPLISLDGSLSFILDSLSHSLPDTLGLEATGILDAQAKGSLNLSQANLYTFAEANLRGYVRSTHLDLHSSKDSIDIHLDSLDVTLATLGNTRDTSVEEGTRMIALVASLDSAYLRYGTGLTASGRALSLKAQNDASILDSRDSSSYYPFGGLLEIGDISLMDSDSTTISLKGSKNIFRISPSPEDKALPRLTLTSDNSTVRAMTGYHRFIVKDLSLKATADKSTPRTQRAQRTQHRTRAFRDSIQIPDWLSEEDFRKKDLDFKLDEAMARYYREWDFNAAVGFKLANVMTPVLPLINMATGMSGTIDNNKIVLDGLNITSGRSNLGLKGSISGLRRALLRNGTLNIDADITSNKLMVNELLSAYDLGKKITAKLESMGPVDAIDDNTYASILMSGTTDTEPADSGSLLVIPANLTANIRVNATGVNYSTMDISELHGEATLRERCLQIVNTAAKTNVGNIDLEAFYATRTKQDISAGFNLTMQDITAEKIVEMLPAVDSIVPMLKSFKGNLDCELAATTQIDTNMNMMLPSLKGVMRIKGQNLALVESEDLYSIAELLKFKNIHNIAINDMSVEAAIGDNKVEIFPFIMNIDRYTLAMSGIQHLDQNFRYHISVLKSPLLIRFGLDLYGDNFDAMKFKIGKAKYKNRNIPVFSEVIDETRLNLSQAIRDIFTRGIETAIRENEQQAAIVRRKEEIGYVNAAETGIEELSSDETKMLDEEVEAVVGQDSAEALKGELTTGSGGLKTKDSAGGKSRRGK